MKPYSYEPHPHVGERKSPELSSNSSLSLNEKIGLRITSSIGTMTAAYFFVGLALISLPAALHSGDTIIIVSWIAQTFLQLVLLPIIIVGQNIQSKQSERRAIATYKDADALLHESKEIQNHLAAQDILIQSLRESILKLEAQRKTR